MLIKWLPDYTSLFSDRNIRKKRKARIYHYHTSKVVSGTTTGSSAGANLKLLQRSS
jgi:hypothetical protein